MSMMEGHMSDKTILYVEDNEYNLKIVRQLLGRTSYRLIEAMDGQLGWRRRSASA